MSSVSSVTPGPLKKRRGPRREPRQQTADMAELDSPAKNTRRNKRNTQQLAAPTPDPTPAAPKPITTLSDEIPVNNSEGTQEQNQSRPPQKEVNSFISFIHFFLLVKQGCTLSITSVIKRLHNYLN